MVENTYPILFDKNLILCYNTNMKLEKAVQNFHNFIKDETSQSVTTGEVIDSIQKIAKNSKRAIGTGLALATIFSAIPETSNSAETTKQFTNTTLVECFTSSKHNLSTLITPCIDQAKTQTKENSFQDIFMPFPTNNKNDFGTATNYRRQSYMYDSYNAADIVINGKYDKELIKQNTKKWVEAMKNGVETQKNYASFELVPKGNDNYTLKITGISPELNKYKQVYINAVAIENIVNLPYYENGMSTIRNLVQEWLIKASYRNEDWSYRGESVFLKNGEAISRNIKLNIPKGLENKYSIVAWVQENDGAFIAKKAEILSAAVCSLNEGKILKFNWNNWPKNMQDENLMVKPEYYMPLGLGEMNLNLENAENLKTMNFDFNKLDFKDIYRIVGVKPNPELFDITFDQRYNRTVLKFHKSFTGNLENAITFIADFKKSNVNAPSGVRFCWFDVRNKDGDFPYVDMSGEPIQDGPVKLVISGYKPLDFNKDRKIDYDDVNKIVEAFGCIPTDPEWNQKFDIDKNNRIDIKDLTTIIKAADAENALRAQFHDNLKRLDIWEKKELPMCKIKNALYGNEGKWIDVTETLQDKLENGDFEMRITSDNLCKGKDPDYGTTKTLKIIYDDKEQKDFEIKLEEWDTYKFKKECSAIQSKTENTNSEWYNDFNNRKNKKEQLRAF